MSYRIYMTYTDGQIQVTDVPNWHAARELVLDEVVAYQIFEVEPGHKLRLYDLGCQEEDQLLELDRYRENEYLDKVGI